MIFAPAAECVEKEAQSYVNISLFNTTQQQQEKIKGNV